MIKTIRIASGSYQYTHSDGTIWQIQRMYNWETDQPTNFWTFSKYGEPANDIFCSKYEALLGLMEILGLELPR